MQTPDCEKTLPEYIKINSTGCYTMESIDVCRCSVLSSLNKEESKYCGKTSPSSGAHFLLPFLKADLPAASFRNGRCKFKWKIVYNGFECSTHSSSAGYESTSRAVGLDGMTSQLLLWIVLYDGIQWSSFPSLKDWRILGPKQAPSVLETCFEGQIFRISKAIESKLLYAIIFFFNAAMCILDIPLCLQARMR